MKRLSKIEDQDIPRKWFSLSDETKPNDRDPIRVGYGKPIRVIPFSDGPFDNPYD